MDTITTKPRPFKKVGECLVVADYRTPACDQRYGYVLAPLTEVNDDFSHD